MVSVASSESYARPARDMFWLSRPQVSPDPGASHEPLREPPRRLPNRWQRLTDSAGQPGRGLRDHDGMTGVIWLSAELRYDCPPLTSMMGSSFGRRTLRQRPHPGIHLQCRSSPEDPQWSQTYEFI